MRRISTSRSIGRKLDVDEVAAAHERGRHHLSDAVLVEQAEHVVDAGHGLGIETHEQIAGLRPAWSAGLPGCTSRMRTLLDCVNPVS